MKKANYKLRYYLFSFLNVILSITPLCIYGGINLNRYFGNKNSIFTNAIGFGLLAGMIIIVLLKQTKFLQGVLGLIIFELILIFLDVYIQDLKYILGYAILGLLIAKMTTGILAKKYERLYLAHENADITANAMDNNINKLVEEIKGLGRA